VRLLPCLPTWLVPVTLQQAPSAVADRLRAELAAQRRCSFSRQPLPGAVPLEETRAPRRGAVLGLAGQTNSSSVWLGAAGQAAERCRAAALSPGRLTGHGGHGFHGPAHLESSSRQDLGRRQRPISCVHLLRSLSDGPRKGHKWGSHGLKVAVAPVPVTGQTNQGSRCG